MSLPLAGRTALVTGVSRRRGIGFAVASRLASMGASLAVHHHLPHDLDEYGDVDSLTHVLGALRESLRGDATLVDVAGDLGDAATAEDLIPVVNGRAGTSTYSSATTHTGETRWRSPTSPRRPSTGTGR